MYLQVCVLVSVLLLSVDERLLVSGSSRSISAYVGEDITLNCSVNSHIKPEHIEEVSWRKTDGDEDILVLLYLNNKAFPDLTDEQYRDRVEFFTDEIPKGNFSLRLKSVRTEDKGVYMCHVFAGVLSANSTVVLERLGFSVSHIMVLILCVSTSVSALLLCFIIYCRLQSEDLALSLQMCLVICPNLIMCLAFVFWGVSEGSLFETVSCSALFFLRPLILLWAAPYVNEFTGKIKTFIQNYSCETEYIVFSAVFYSVLFKSALKKSMNYVGFEGVMIILYFVVALLFELIYIIFLLAKFIERISKQIQSIFEVLAGISFDVLPLLQFIILFYAFGSARGGYFIVAVLPVFLIVTRYNWDDTCGRKMGCSPSVGRSVWIIVMLSVNAVMVYFYIITLENEKDRMGWTCTIAFLQLLWAVVNFAWSFKCELHRFVPVYLFGSVVVVLVNAVTLMTELILKTVNGYGAVRDMRVVVFSSEFIFTLFLMTLLVFEPLIETCQPSPENAGESDEPPANGSNQNTAESQEMSRL